MLRGHVYLIFRGLPDLSRLAGQAGTDGSVIGGAGREIEPMFTSCRGKENGSKDAVRHLTVSAETVGTDQIERELKKTAGYIRLSSTFGISGISRQRSLPVKVFPIKEVSR